MLNKVTNFLKNNYYLVLIIIIALLTRFWGLSQNPPSLNWDEVSHGYNAFSILRAGKDEWGNWFPLIFRAYGDYKLPVYIYLTVISEFFFGLTPFAVRFVSALAGVGTVILTYFFVLEFVRKNGLPSAFRRSLALISSLLVAVEPWSLFLSRAAFEANLALFLFVAGMYFFFKFLNSHTSYFLVPTSVFFGLTVWTYNSYRIFTPLILIILIVIFWKEIISAYIKNRSMVYGSVLTLLFFFIPMFFQLFSSAGTARYSWVQILDQGTIAKIEETRNKGESRFLHNKVTYFVSNFAGNYVSHFSPQFLFFEGGSNYQFSIPGRGILSIINLPFLVLGIIFLLNETLKKNKVAILILAWSILSFVPSSLTREAPHVLRTITFLPVPMILSATGLLEFIKFIRKYFRIYYIQHTIYFSLLAISTFGYFRDYFIDYRLKYSQSWQYGYIQASQFIKENYSVYDKILITKKYGEPHEFLLFNLKWEPSDYISDPILNRFQKTDWYWVDGFDKFYFINDWEISENNTYNLPRSQPDKNVFKLESGGFVNCYSSGFKCLLVTSPGNFPDGWVKLKTINFPNGDVAFEIYEN